MCTPQDDLLDSLGIEDELQDPLDTSNFDAAETNDDEQSFNIEADTPDAPEEQPMQTSSHESPSDQQGKKQNTIEKSKDEKLTKLPIARVKNIMKLDPDVTIVSQDAAFLVTKAAELFLESLAKETYLITARSKRKTMQKRDLDLVIENVDALCFLEGVFES